MIELLKISKVSHLIHLNLNYELQFFVRFIRICGTFTGRTYFMKLVGYILRNYVQGAIHIHADIFDRTSNYKSHAKSLNHHKPHCSSKDFWHYRFLMMMWFTLKKDSNLPNLLLKIQFHFSFENTKRFRGILN